ncbi:hypothetical protein [Desulfobotulus alkaliphilus]|uniref:hypothetical protein n=1 Tax=Desulfobotulus alkaliphilus TaxID=622671 RepID=UPI0011AA2CA6|nr:hypothetical protein [Desulfobotulus alkaliphilus]
MGSSWSSNKAFARIPFIKALLRIIVQQRGELCLRFIATCTAPVYAARREGIAALFPLGKAGE